ncbi:hypothetical protein AAER60_07370, partial [Acinetobacter baumannii]
CRIYKAEGDSVDEGGVFDYISGGSVNVAHDCLLLVEQTVEQGALAHIRLAYDGYGYSLLQGIAGFEGVGEGGNLVIDFFG